MLFKVEKKMNNKKTLDPLVPFVLNINDSDSSCKKPSIPRKYDWAEGDDG